MVYDRFSPDRLLITTMLKTNKQKTPHPIMIYSGESGNILNNTGLYCRSVVYFKMCLISIAHK